MSVPLVIYHAHCQDGFASAWIAWRRFHEFADYLPVAHGEEPPLEKMQGRDVFILDFSWKRPPMEEILRLARKVVVLDHHQTAQQELASLVLAGPHQIVFDMDHAGARLAWDYFFPGQQRPWLVDYVEDRDLWQWHLPDSREINAALASYPHDFMLWESWARKDVQFEAAQKLQFTREGAAILRYQEQLVKDACKEARAITLDGHAVLAVNATCLISEITGRLALDRPFGCSFRVRPDGKTEWSLRSSPEGLDVSEIARKHGGGGHRHAAGFVA